MELCDICAKPLPSPSAYWNSGFKLESRIHAVAVCVKCSFKLHMTITKKIQELQKEHADTRIELIQDMLETNKAYVTVPNTRDDLEAEI